MVRGSTHLSHIVGVLLAMVIGMTAAGAVQADGMTTEETRAMMTKFLKYLHSGKQEDVVKFSEFYADDVEAHYHTTGPLGKYFFGREAFLNFYLKGAEEVNFEHGLKVDRYWVVVEGNIAVVRNRTRGHRYGAPFVQEYVHVYYWEDDKIVRMEGFNNAEAEKSAQDIAKRKAANKAAMK